LYGSNKYHYKKVIYGFSQQPMRGRMCHEQWTDETRLDTSSHFAENTFQTMTWHSRHRHNLRDRLGTPYLQSLGLNKVYHSDLMHNVSQLVCEKNSFWGGGEFGIIMAAKHRAMMVLSLMQRNVGHRLSSIQINLKYA
jgi:hypothetical protein